MAPSFSRQPSQHSWLPFRPTDRQTNRPEALNEPLISRQRRLFAIERHRQGWIIAPTGVYVSPEFRRQSLYGSSNKVSLMTGIGPRVLLVLKLRLLSMSQMQRVSWQGYQERGPLIMMSQGASSS